MAANFESGVTYGEKSWHGQENNLGVDDARRYSVSGSLEAAGMNWRVAKVQLGICQPRPASHDDKGNQLFAGDGHSADLTNTVAEGVYGVFRTDRWECLGSVGKDYHTLQNEQIFEKFQPFLDCKQLAFESAGSLDGGRKVYVQARLAEDDADLGGGDKIKPMLLIASSHDGSLATRVGFTPIRVVCQNTLAAAIANKRSQLLKIRHTKNQGIALDEVMRITDIARQEFRANIEQYQSLQRHKISKADLSKYVKLVLGIDPNETDRSKLSTRIQNQWEAITNLAVYGKGQSNGELTAWSAYNGVTEWLSHKRQADANKRQNSLWFGSSAEMNQKALQLAFALAS